MGPFRFIVVVMYLDISICIAKIVNFEMSNQQRKYKYNKTICQILCRLSSTHKPLILCKLLNNVGPPLNYLFFKCVWLSVY
jgi:hypothetical protein